MTNETVKIEIPKELFEKLKDLGHEYLTQDNRVTAKPYYFVIREPDREYGIDLDYATDSAWVHKECSENFYEPGDELPEDFNKEDYHEVGIRDGKHKYSNVFLTEKGIKKHIEQNRHHYHENVDTYVNYADRNPEMEAIVEFLELVGKD